jgi:hypothetical protein
LRLTAALYLLLVALAVLGLRDWRRAESQASKAKLGTPGEVN